MTRGRSFDDNKGKQPRPRGKTAVGPRVFWSPAKRMFVGKRKDPSGTWKSKPVPVSAASKPEHQEQAQAWFEAWSSQSNIAGTTLANQHVVIDDKRTIRSLGPKWLAWRKETLPKRRCRGDEDWLDSWVYPHRIADVDLERELGIGHVTAWIEWVKARGRAPMTNRNRIQALRSFIDDCTGKGWIPDRDNPLRHRYVRKALGKVETVAGNNVIIRLSGYEVTTLLTTTPPKRVSMVRVMRYLFAVATGCRAGEIAALRWRDVDLKPEVPTVRVFWQLEVVDGQPTFRAPKWDSHRELPIHPTLLRALRWWHDVGWLHHVGTSPAPDDPVFASNKGTHSYQRYSPNFQLDLAHAGLSPLFEGEHTKTFHSLRRTFMSMLEDAGVERRLIDSLAGHSGATTADRSYISKNITSFARAVNKLPLPTDLPWVPK